MYIGRHITGSYDEGVHRHCVEGLPQDFISLSELDDDIWDLEQTIIDTKLWI